MNFLNPYGLIGLLALPIIAILHMRREYARRAVVSSLRLWSFLEVQMHGSIPRKLPITPLLLLDIAIAGLLSLALAQPVINNLEIFSPGKHIVILMDTSTSMLANENGATRKDLALEEANRLIYDATKRDVVTVLSFSGDVVLIGDSREDNISIILDRIDSLVWGGEGSDLQSALALAEVRREKSLPTDLHIFTDGDYSLSDEIDLNGVTWHLYASILDNQSILVMNIASISKTKNQVFMQIANTTNNEAIREIQLIGDGELIASDTLVLPPNSVNSWIRDVTGELNVFQAQLIGDDALPEDDVRYAIIHPERSIKIAMIAENPEPLDRALQAIGENVELSIFLPGEPIFGTGYDLYVYRGVFPEAFPVGNVLIVEPPGEANLVDNGVLQINDQYLKDIDFNGVDWGEVVNIDIENRVPLMQTDQSQILIASQEKRTQIFILALKLSSGNFSRHPAFPLLVSAIADQVLANLLPTELGLGEDWSGVLGSKFISGDLYYGSDLISEIPPEEAFSFQPNITGVFVFDLVDTQNMHKYVPLVVNAGSAAEAKLAPGEWVYRIQNHSDHLSGRGVGDFNLSPWLLMLAFALMFLEARWAWR